MKTQLTEIYTYSNASPGKRAAIHAPVIQMFSANYNMTILPGMRVEFLDDVCFRVLPDSATEFDGVVSPFIEPKPPLKSEVFYFWILVHPKLLDGTVQHYFQVDHANLTRQVIAEETKDDDDDECTGCYN